MTFLATLALLSFSLLSSALPLEPRQSTVCPSPAGDAPYSLPCSNYTSAVTCPNGIKGKAGGIVFLVHGTGSTGSESWAAGPYNLLLPSKGPGYDICWVDLPGRSLVDAQLSAEYVAYNIHDLAGKSATGTVAVIGHSQGAGLNPQWGLLYWPSTRALVTDYIALAPDFHGTAEGPLVCDAFILAQEGGCEPSLWQQDVGSKYLAAQNVRGNQALVTTTAIYTLLDDVIQPEIVNPTSDLSGAAVFPLQAVCPGHVADHFSMIIDPAAFYLALDALTHPGPASASRFDLSYCSYLEDDVLISNTFTSTPALLASIVADLTAFGVDPKVPAEPLLKAYVCAAGDATSYCETILKWEHARRDDLGRRESRLEREVEGEVGFATPKVRARRPHQREVGERSSGLLNTSSILSPDQLGLSTKLYQDLKAHLGRVKMSGNDTAGIGQDPAQTTAPYDPNLLSALASLRLALPVTLLGIIIVRVVVKAFLTMMDKIQAQGWVQDPDWEVPVAVGGPASRLNPPSEEEDVIHPVVVRVGKLRRGLVFGLFAIAAATYFAEGVVQIIATLISNTYTPDLPVFENIAAYVSGSLLGLAGCAILMSLEERANGEANWGKLYPKMVAFLGWGLEVAVFVITIKLVQQSPPTKDDSLSYLLPTHLGLLSFRLLLLTFLCLSQTPLLYKSTFVPWSSVNPSSTSERTSLLSSQSNGNGYGATAPPAKPKNPLQSTRAPSNRPPDPKSLSILTLFSRVRTLFPYLWPYKSFALQVLALICVGLMLLKRVVNVMVPFLFGMIISDLAAGRPPYLNIGLYVVASFLRDSNTMLYRYLWLPIEQYSEREMSMMSFDCLLNLSLSYHTKRRTGELMRVLDRSDAINDFFQTLIFTFIPVIIDIPVAVVVLQVKYGLLIVSIVTVVSLIFVSTSIALAESRTKLYRKLRDEGQFMYQVKTDTMFNYETVKIFNGEAFESNRLRTAMRVYQKGYFQVYNAWNSLSLIQDSISAVGLLLCSFILAHRVITGELEVGAYVTFVSYLAQIYGPLNRIAGLYRDIMKNLVDTEQLMDLLSEEKDIVDRPNAVKLTVGSGGIEFKDVKFSYDGKKETIKGISFSIPAGHSVALVGASGGGKSTIMRLLYRFYDIQEGSIKIDGIDIRDVTQASLRKNIGLVPQGSPSHPSLKIMPLIHVLLLQPTESVLFNETARYNLAYGGGEGVTMEEIEEAARAASLHDRIMSFPDQYETRVGERGQRLSGGEKQRVAIARVLLKNAPILLLDEATSALDTVNERAIQKRLNEISKGRTTLAIAHRLSTIVQCDTIHVLNEGVIAESGSHHELLAKDGIYAELWQKQIQADGEAMEGVVVGEEGSGHATPILKVLEAEGKGDGTSTPQTPALQD